MSTKRWSQRPPPPALTPTTCARATVLGPREAGKLTPLPLHLQMLHEQNEGASFKKVAKI
jgi:hypothetical protein